MPLFKGPDASDTVFTAMTDRCLRRATISSLRSVRMKTWFITGVSSGFGRALAQTLISRGERVVGTLRNEEQRVEFNKLSDGRSFGCLLDVRSHDDVRRVVAQIEEEVGPIDVL